MFLEIGYGLLRGHNTYRINDTINSLSLGSLSRLQGLVFLGFSAGIYEWVVANYQLSQLADTAWVWVSCFVLYDLAYYWKHRFGHEMVIFWGSHVAHHQSEDFNLSTALRQTSIDFYSFLFYLPFFFLGFPGEMLFTVVSLNLIYQFWVHTEHVPKLGPLEWRLVTPSNHRVHHGRNSIYVDKNYGGVFIIWDRIFGSFQEELADEPVRFGLRKPLNSFNPLWANVHVYWRLLRDWLQAPGLRNKLVLPFKAPGWQPLGMSTRCALKKDVAIDQVYDPKVTPFRAYYTLFQFSLTVGLSLYLLVNIGTVQYSETVIAVAFLAFCFYVHGTWMEGRSSALSLEITRLALLALLLGGSAISVNYLAVLYAIVAISVLALLFVRYRRPLLLQAA
ncbi:MAG: sterol desaturase family protein, partial [Gammaproteobacteria bacterium]